MTQDSLSRIASDEVAPRFSRLQDIADALSCPVVDLFRFTAPESLEGACVPVCASSASVLCVRRKDATGAGMAWVFIKHL